MLQPKCAPHRWLVVGDSGDFSGGFAHPAFAPSVDDAVPFRVGGQEAQRNFQNDGIYIFARLRVSAAINEAKISLRVFVIGLAIPSWRARRQIKFFAPTVVGTGRIEIEKLISFQFNQRFGNGKLAQIGLRLFDVIKLRRVIYRAKESGKVVEESVVAAADECLNGEAIGRIDGQNLIDLDFRRKVAAGKIGKPDRGSI